MAREDRSNDAPRSIEVSTGIICGIDSSVQYRCGNTTILCVASLEEGTPKWNTKPSGWATADYQMMPYSVTPRLDRVSHRSPDGRATEIKRLIGRSLRAGLDLSLMPGYTIRVDCDVLHADGGTRTASINACAVAVSLLIQQHLTSGILATDPRRALILGMSAGILDQELLVDLDYEEDSSASLDLNLIGTSTGEVVEVVGGCERGPVAMETMQSVIDAARGGIVQVSQMLDEHLVAMSP
jgi:ribonuclease PH